MIAYDPAASVAARVKNWERDTERRAERGEKPNPKPTEPAPDPANNREIYEQFEERNGMSLFIYEWVVDEKYAAPERLYVSKEIREREERILGFMGGKK